MEKMVYLYISYLSIRCLYSIYCFNYNIVTNMTVTSPLTDFLNVTITDKSKYTILNFLRFEAYCCFC